MTKTRLSKAIALCFATSNLFSTSHVHADTYPVTVNNDNGTGLVANTLSWAILQANTNPGADEILLQTDVTVTGVMKRLIDSDTTLSSDSTRRTISGNNEFRPLFIKSGQVTIKDLDFNNGFAKGGDSKYGGRGAGLGGCLFIYDGNVNLTNLNFFRCHAMNGTSGIYINSSGGGGLYGSGTWSNGGGLFANNGYGGYGLYQNNNNDFGQGGLYASNTPAGAGGFGGGGGFGYYNVGGQGGFGAGGGASYYQTGANGGFGGGGGISHYGYGNGSAGFGGFQKDAAAFGGGIFIRSGQLKINNTTFVSNRAINQNSQGEAFGGAIFILHTLNNSNGNNQGMPSTLPIVDFCNVQFNNNIADTSPQVSNNNQDVFDLANIVTQTCHPDIKIFSNGNLINDGDTTPDSINGTLFENAVIGLSNQRQSFSIRNNNTAPLNLVGQPAIAIQQMRGQFSITQQPNSTTLNHLDEVTFEVTFTPMYEGLDYAVISIESNDPDENPYDFVIAAEGIEPQPKLQVTYQDQIIEAEDEIPSISDGTDFGFTPVSGGLIERTFEISNIGFAPLELSNHTGSIHTVSQDNSMSITSQLTQFELQPNESIPFTVAFDPTQVGPASINYVNITSNDPNFSDYFFQVTGYGQATMWLNSHHSHIQEGEEFVVEIATDFPLYEDTLIQFSLYGEVDESDFIAAPPLSGQYFMPANSSSELIYFPTIQDGVTEGLEYLSFAILSEDPAINQTTPFIVSGSIDDDLIFIDGFEGNQNN